MKIIFLDIDGVLNNYNSYVKETRIVWEKECVDRLNKITDKTGAKIVISSTWRFQEHHVHAYENDMGIKGEIIDKTPRSTNILSCRGDEIWLWLQEHPEVEKFVILDDSSDMRDMFKYLIQTNPEFGLTDSDVERVIERFNDTQESDFWRTDRRGPSGFSCCRKI